MWGGRDEGGGRGERVRALCVWVCVCVCVVVVVVVVCVLLLLLLGANGSICSQKASFCIQTNKLMSMSHTHTHIPSNRPQSQFTKPIGLLPQNRCITIQS